MATLDDMLAINKATYWAPGSRDGYGNLSYAAPVEIDCRWEDTQELFVTAQGEEATSQAQVFVSEDLENMGYLYLGTSDVADPRSVAGALLIRKFEKTPNWDGSWYERVAWL